MTGKLEPLEEQAPNASRKRHRILIAVATVLLVVALAMLAALEYIVHHAEPILRARVIETLETRFQSRVELAEFRVSLIQGLQVTGRALKLFPLALPSDKPLFAVDQFHFRTTWKDLLKTPMNVGYVRVDGLQINLPPKEQRHDIPRLNPGNRRGKIEINVDQIDINNATLILGTSKPGKVPLDFEISHAALRSVGPGKPLHFDATLVNPKPVGDIQSSGNFGPFDAASPADTAVDGEYSFSNADLSTLKGIGGILSSTGKYAGTLGSIVVDGTTDTPDFRISVSGHPVPLHTKFHATVDGTNGDTYLDPVDATILHSHVLARGKVVRVPNAHGHDISLDVIVDRARIEDLLQLGMRTEPPVMTGGVQLQTKLKIPPGEQDVTERLQLRGSFLITNAHFNNDKIQARVDELSMVSQGKPKEGHDDIPDNVKSEMKGNFNLAGAKVTVSSLNFDVPGANVQMDGTYSLDGNEFDFHGKARLKAHLSEMVTGWKSILLKPVDPFFAKNGAGTELPIKVTGTTSEPKFGLDFHRKDNKDSPKVGNTKDDKQKDSGIVTAPK